MNDEIKKIERLARINREKSLGSQSSKNLDKQHKVKYIDKSAAYDEDIRYADADKLFNEMKRKPRYD